MNPSRKGFGARSSATAIPLSALLALTVLAVVLAAQAGLTPCPDDDLRGQIGGYAFTICPVVVGLLFANALLAAAAIVVLVRAPQRMLVQRAVVHTLASLPPGRTAGVLALLSAAAVGVMLVLAGDGPPAWPTCALVAALLAGSSLAAALFSIAAGRVAVALGRRLILAIVAAIARAADPLPVRLGRRRPAAALRAASLLAARRGLRAPPVFVR